jgi:hypothetical protein
MPTRPPAIALLLVLLASVPARAQDCPLPEGANPRLADVPASLRLAFLRESLNHDARNALIWKWAWTGAYAAGAVGQLAFSPLFAKSQRNDLYVGAVESGLALLPLVTFPLSVGWDGPTFDAQVAAATPADTCTLIREGEMLTIRDAANEAAGVGWLMQVVNVVYNFVFAAIVGWGFHYPWTIALANGVAGTAIGEGMILSQPTHLNVAWKSYLLGNVGQEQKPTVTFGPTPGSVLGVTGTF